MLKMLACMCFLMGSGGWGLLKVWEYRKRYQELVYIRYILNAMLIEMEHQKGTFGETCRRLALKLRQPYSDIFLGMYDLLEKEREKTPALYWKEQIGKISDALALHKEEVEILYGIIRCVDASTICMPLEIIRQSMVEWDKVICKAEQIRDERSKVTLCLSISAGLVLCITIL